MQTAYFVLSDRPNGHRRKCRALIERWGGIYSVMQMCCLYVYTVNYRAVNLVKQAREAASAQFVGLQRQLSRLTRPSRTQLFWSWIKVSPQCVCLYSPNVCPKDINTTWLVSACGPSELESLGCHLVIPGLVVCVYSGDWHWLWGRTSYQTECKHLGNVRTCLWLKVFL